MQIEIAYYAEERLIVLVIKHGAYASLVRYAVDGIEYETYVDNADLLFIDYGIGYESDE